MQVMQVITGLLLRYRAFDLGEECDDLAQEIFLAFFSAVKAGKLRNPRATVSYLDSTTWRRLADWRRRRPRIVESTGSEEADTPRAAQPEVLTDLERCVGALTDRARRVLQAVYLEGLSYEEGARELDMPEGTLRHVRTVALKAVRRCLGLDEVPK